MTKSISQTFFDILNIRIDDRAKDWLDALLKKPFDEKTFPVAYAGAARRFGRDVIEASPEEIAALESAIPFSSPFSWTCGELGRAAMLVWALKNSPEARHIEIVEDLYYKGDNAERRALLRTLPFLAQPKRFLPLAIDACRTNVVTVFEGIACENAFPSTHFPESNFNQLVLKTLFLGLELERVFDWKKNNNDKLFHMADDYARERRFAGRSVPAGNLNIIEHFRRKK